MQGEAKSSADKDRADVEAKATQLEGQGRADAAVTMGEDSIETSVPVEELSAKAIEGAAGAAAGDAALPTVAGAASSGEVGIIAQEESGAEIDAALGKASADMAVERTRHVQEDAKARADADKQVSDLKTQADADTAAAKSAAKADVDKARGEWKGEIDKKGADARKQADKKVQEGMAEVEAEQTKANDEAKKHVEEAKDKAETEKQKGEKEAGEAKEKGKKKSSGFGGWLARKARAFCDGIKKAVSAAIDAAKKAVKAVIDAAKKLAMAAIELASKAITAAIKAIGKALIAITDVLLAAFPELKAKFQKAIKGLVDKAVNAVNKLAEGLKKAVQKALDALQSAINRALDLLEKGLHAIVDAANAVVQAAIKAAEAVAAALGVWLKLIKDVATGPGSWIGKLGAAVVDGIRNHLWSAFKTAVVEWFKSKVMELLGVGGILLSILLEGGISTDDIVKMALDALIVAIPIALVAILIEKLVSMIVPAAGAVLAIIEGLQAAWGTISRIIAAFGAFMAFLLAVQGGGAGPLFATALAAAAIVLLDFVSNWLIKKLAGPAKKVGARLKGMGDKLKGKRGKGAKGKPKAHARPTRKKDGDGPGGPHAKGKPGTPKKKPADTSKDLKKKDPKKDKARGEQAVVQRAAQRAANAAWRNAKARSAQRIQSQSTMKGIVEQTPAGASGVRVRVSLVESGGSWRVRATAMKGSTTATVTTGSGTTMKAKAGGTWYASRDLKSRHQAILRDTARELNAPDRGDHKDVQAAYDAKVQLARRLETKGQAQIDGRIHGVKFDITMEPLAGVTQDHQIKTKLLISPNYEELDLNVKASTDGTFDELVKRLGAEVASKNPYHNEDVILAGCEMVASSLGVTWTTIPQPGGNTLDVADSKGRAIRTTLIKFAVTDADGKEKTHIAEIVRKTVSDKCASCGAETAGPTGTSRPHNVVSQDSWSLAVDDALAVVGEPTGSPLVVEVLGHMQGESGAFGHGQKQCPDCETPGSVAKTGVTHPRQGATLSLIQRGSLPNAGSDGSIVGEQFGGVASTPAERDAITTVHVKKVLARSRGLMPSRYKRYAGDPAHAITDPAGKLEAFYAALHAAVLVRVS
jgi:hypothetical protein